MRVFFFLLCLLVGLFDLFLFLSRSLVGTKEHTREVYSVDWCATRGEPSSERVVGHDMQGKKAITRMFCFLCACLFSFIRCANNYF
jgi:hypothetical protein